MLVVTIRTKIRLQPLLQQYLEFLLDCLRLLREEQFKDFRVLLQDIENGRLVEICDPEVNFSLVAQIVTPREKLRYVHTRLRYAVQILGYSLLGSKLPSLTKMVEELVRLEAVVVNDRGRGIMVVPFDGEDIAATCSILDPCAL